MTCGVDMSKVVREWDAIQRGIDGDVILPGSVDYESVRKPVMARFQHLRPAAVVRCASPADVAATLAVARELRVPIAIRSGDALCRVIDLVRVTQ